MNVINDETHIQPPEIEQTENRHRFKTRVALAGVALVGFGLAVQSMTGIGTPGSKDVQAEGSIEPQPTETSGSPDLSVTVENQLDDSETPEIIGVPESLKERVKETTFQIWRRPQGSDAPFNVSCAANYIAVDGQNVFTTAKHCATTYDDGTESGILDRYKQAEESVSPLEIHDITGWEMVITQVGDDPNTAEPLATVEEMTVNAGARIDDLMVVKPGNISPELANIEPMPYQYEAFQPGARAMITRVNENGELEMLPARYIGRGLQSKTKQDIQNFVIERDVADPELDWGGTSGMAAYVLDERNIPIAMVLPHSATLSEGDVSRGEMTAEQLSGALNTVRLQIPQKIKVPTDGTIVQFTAGTPDIISTLVNH